MKYLWLLLLLAALAVAGWYDGTLGLALGLFAAGTAFGDDVMDTILFHEGSTWLHGFLRRLGITPRSWGDRGIGHGVVRVITDTVADMFADGWHLAKALRNTCWFAAGLLPWGLSPLYFAAAVVLLHLFFGLTHQAFFAGLYLRKQRESLPPDLLHKTSERP